MKPRKEFIIIILLMVAFIAFFVNAMIVLGDKNAQIRTLKQVHEALERDHRDLRKEKLRLMKSLNEALRQPAQEPEKEDSTQEK